MNIEKLIEKAGGIKTVADQLGVTTQTIYNWCRQGYIPLMRIRDVAALAGIPEGKLGVLVP